MQACRSGSARPATGADSRGRGAVCSRSVPCNTDRVYPRGRGRCRLGHDDMVPVVCLIPAIARMLLRCCRVIRFKGLSSSFAGDAGFGEALRPEEILSGFVGRGSIPRGRGTRLLRRRAAFAFWGDSRRRGSSASTVPARTGGCVIVPRSFRVFVVDSCGRGNGPPFVALYFAVDWVDSRRRWVRKPAAGSIYYSAGWFPRLRDNAQGRLS